MGRLAGLQRKVLLSLVVAATMLVLAACGGGQAGSGSQTGTGSQGGSGSQTAGDQLSGTIRIDGSSTVYPITQAIAEEFMGENPGVNVTVGVSGTGGGFEKFTRGEIEISDASRPIKDEEKARAEENGIAYTELEVALDGIAVVVNQQNDWVDHLTVEELKKIWEPNSKVKKWSDIRPGWPDQPINLYGPGTDSGTFDYFTDEIVGEEGASRTDYTASEDDNQLVTGVANDKYALGYFGYAYYVENKDKLRAVPIDAGNGPVEPNDETVAKGTYKPLSRPLFIYINNEAYKTRPEVKAFVDYYLEVVKDVASEVGYIALKDDVLAEQVAKLEQLK